MGCHCLLQDVTERLVTAKLVLLACGGKGVQNYAIAYHSKVLLIIFDLQVSSCKLLAILAANTAASHTSLSKIILSKWCIEERHCGIMFNPVLNIHWLYDFLCFICLIFEIKIIVYLPQELTVKMKCFNTCVVFSR